MFTNGKQDDVEMIRQLRLLYTGSYNLVRCVILYNRY